MGMPDSWFASWKRIGAMIRRIDDGSMTLPLHPEAYVDHQQDIHTEILVVIQAASPSGILLMVSSGSENMHRVG